MSGIVAETSCALRRLRRRPGSAGALGLAALLLAYAGVARPVASVREAVSAAAGIATAVLLVVAAGIVADDRERGRLAVPATHPVPPASWAAGRWLAVWTSAGAAFVTSAAVLLVVARDPVAAARAALALAAAAAHLGALAGVAVALSCRVGATAQTLLLVAFVAAGAMPPDLVGVVPGAVARVLWALLPTSWALGRLHGWILAGGAPAPWLAVALALQPAGWLALAARSLTRAELPVRGT